MKYLFKFIKISCWKDLFDPFLHSLHSACNNWGVLYRGRNWSVFVASSSCCLFISIIAARFRYQLVPNWHHLVRVLANNSQRYGDNEWKVYHVVVKGIAILKFTQVCVIIHIWKLLPRSSTLKDLTIGWLEQWLVLAMPQLSFYLLVKTCSNLFRHLVMWQHLLNIFS